MESSKNSIDYLFESYDSQTKFIEHFIDSFSKYDEKTIIEKIKSFEKIIEIFHFPFSLLLNNDSIQNNLAFACYTNPKIKDSTTRSFRNSSFNSSEDTNTISIKDESTINSGE